ncbi:MAG: hypothetical protein ACRDNK_24025 [Solirubrobacteraceae bacterium]
MKAASLPWRRRTGVLAFLLAAAAAVLLAALLVPGGARASSTQEMILQDDTALIYSSPSQVQANLQTLKNMGVDRVRVSVVWSLVAPSPTAALKPGFDATNPAAYPAGVWDRWDLIDLAAQKLGIGVYFQPTAPAPTWATGPVVRNQGYRYTSKINGKLYGQFFQAVATRYDGHYPATDLAGKTAPLPRVSYWGIYNEPNIGGWTTPQWLKVRGREVEASPAIYRRMLDGAWRALTVTGHRHDTILIGETAAYGARAKGYGDSMDPLIFMRSLYCLSSRYTPLTGRSAATVGCPRAGSRLAFTRAHPGLFYATGWAHHPYDFVHAPSFKRRDPNSASLSGIARLEHGLDHARRAYHKAARVPIYITEWGVQSRNPNPFIKFSQAQQAEYLNQGEYMAFRNPRVRSFAQFLLVDDAPNTQYPVGSRAYWSTFDSGLLAYGSSQPKPAYYAFELPLWLPKARHGQHVYVWAQIRPSSAARVGTLQFQARGAQTWSNVKQVTGTGAEGYVSTHVALPSAGSLRLSWTGVGQTLYSRTAQVS